MKAIRWTVLWMSSDIRDWGNSGPWAVHYWGRSNCNSLVLILGAWHQLWECTWHCVWTFRVEKEVCLMDFKFADGRSEYFERVQICCVRPAEFEPYGMKQSLDVATGDEGWMSFCTTQDKQSNRAGWWRALTSNFEGRALQSEVHFYHSLQLSRTNVCRWDTPTVIYHSPVLQWPVPSASPGISEQACCQSYLLLHHNNAAPYKAHLTVQYLEQQTISLFPHPPSSPDNAPCNFWLFSKITGKQFHPIQTVVMLGIWSA